MVKRKNKVLPTLILSSVLSVWIVGGGVTGCQNKQPPTHPINQKAVALKKKQSKRAHPAPSKMKKTVPPKRKSKSREKLAISVYQTRYRTRIESLRDPFVPFIRFNEQLNKRKTHKPLLPLQKYALSQLRLIAVIDAGPKGRWAMVCDPSGKGFTVREGVPIGNEGGIVEKILLDRLIVKEVKVDLLGKKKIKLVTLVLRPEKQGE